jgi:sugar (pentulose or hexulose) kinase
MSVVLAWNPGATSLRAALVDDMGNFLVSRLETAPVATDEGGRLEIDVNTWWQALIGLAREIAAEAPHHFGEVREVVICAITRTDVFTSGQAPSKSEVNACRPFARTAWIRDHEKNSFDNPDAFSESKHF